MKNIFNKLPKFAGGGGNTYPINNNDLLCGIL